MKRRKFITLMGLSLIATVTPIYLAFAISAKQRRVAIAIESSVTVFYVATNGNDNYSGTLAEPNRNRTDGPFVTIERAQQAIRQLKRQQGGSLQEPVTVKIRGGTYYLEKPLLFTPEDSGTASDRITYQAYQGEHPIISGGKKISDWQQQGHLWVAKLNDVAQKKWNFRLLRVGDDWAIRARYPNFDSDKPLTGGWLFAQASNQSNRKGTLNTYLTNLAQKGDRLEWKITVPHSSNYQIWLRYARDDNLIETMSGKTALSFNAEKPVILDNLPNTRDWDRLEWALVGEIALAAGSGVLQWENVAGGSINLDAFCLSDDFTWQPTSAEDKGHLRILPVSPEKHQIIVHAETYNYTNIQDIQIASSQRYRISIADHEFPDWQNWQGGEVHTFLEHNYGNAIFPIAEVDRVDCSIIGDFTQSGYYVAPGSRFFLENVREALTAPHQWYLDTKTGELFYWAQNYQFPLLDVVAPTTDKLIILQGDIQKKSYVEYLTFQGLTFQDTDYTLADSYLAPQDAAIWLKYARFCQIECCQFDLLGGYAVRLEEKSHHNQLVSNQIQRLGQGGILLHSDDTSLQAHDNLIIANQIHDCGRIYKHVAGISVSTGSYNQILHNHIYNLPRYGVTLKSFEIQNRSQHNSIEFNCIENTNLETCDTAAIETLGRDRQRSGNIIRFNLIRNVVGLGTNSEGTILSPYYSWGIYLDDFSSGTTVYGNIIIDTARGSLMLHGGSNNLIENNIFINGETSQLRLKPKDDSMQGNIIRRNIVIYQQTEALLIEVPQELWHQKIVAQCDFNLYWCNNQNLATTKASIFPEGSFTQWQAVGFDRNSLIADPLIIKNQKGKYKLMSNSPAFNLNFLPIPSELIGIKGYQIGKSTT